MRKINPRATDRPTVWVNAPTAERPVTVRSPSPASVANTAAVPVPTGPTTRSGYWAAPGSPAGRTPEGHRESCGPHVAAGGRPGDVPPPTRRACRQRVRRGAPSRRRRRFRAGSARRCRAVPCGSRASPSRQTQLTASCGCVREAPPKDLTRDQADSARRPLRRRPDTIARPARVRIRKRKPCTRARRRLFGWKVRLPLATTFSSLFAIRPLRRFASGSSAVRPEVVLLLLAGAVPGWFRVAAVSPTFGRLFEGTDEPSPGQTWPAATPSRGPGARFSVPVTLGSGVTTITTRTKAPLTLNDPIGMQRNGWQPHGKLLASAKVVLD